MGVIEKWDLTGGESSRRIWKYLLRFKDIYLNKLVSNHWWFIKNLIVWWLDATSRDKYCLLRKKIWTVDYVIKLSKLYILMLT